MMDKEILSKYIPIDDANKSNKLIVLGNQFVQKKIYGGLKVKTGIKKNILVEIEVPDGLKIEDPIHLCFSALSGKIKQHINLKIKLGKNSKAIFLSHCILTSSQDIEHIMHANISLAEGAEYQYWEKHVHSENGKINLKSISKVELSKNSLFKNDFELLKGRAGKTFFDYNIKARENAVAEMETRLKAYAEDEVVLQENVSLNGKKAKTLLKSRVAVLDNAQVEIFNTISAKGAKTRGHIDCQEILLGKGKVKAYPNIEVLNPTAHVSHEASLGGLDNIKMETLMARAKSQKEAEEILLQGILSKRSSNVNS